MDNRNQDLSKTLQLLRDGLHNTIQSFRVYRMEEKDTIPIPKTEASQQTQPTSVQEEQLVSLNESYFENAGPSDETPVTNLLKLSEESFSSPQIQNKNRGKLNLHDSASETVIKHDKRKKGSSNYLKVLKENSNISIHASEANVFFINEDSQNESFQLSSKPSILDSDMSDFGPSETFLDVRDIYSRRVFPTKAGRVDKKLTNDASEKSYIQLIGSDQDADQPPDDIINNTSTYFKDGNRKVDYILVYNKHNSIKMEFYLNNIQKDGLDLEVEESKIYMHLMFAKIHAPKTFLKQMEPRLQIKWSFRNPHYCEQRSTISFTNTSLTRLREIDKISERSPQLAKRTGITDAERIMAVHKLLTETKYGKHIYDFGLERLIETKILECAFPMHDKMWEWNDVGMLCDRQLLNKYWASFNCLFKVQPKQLINKYFGNEIAFYFAWLGFYTEMLLPAAFLGLMVFLYGLLTMNSKILNLQSYEISKSHIVLCPVCQSNCYYSVLSDSYGISKLSYVLDNRVTAIFNILMSFWGITFLILWKQKEYFLKIVWNLSSVNISDINKRAMFYITKKRKGFSTLMDIEKYKKRQSNWWYFFSITVMVISTLTIINIIFGLSVMKLDIAHFYGQSKFFNELIYKINYNSIRVEVIWSTITIILITIIDSFTPIITYRLTRWENPKTESEFEKSYILKLFALTFITNYSIPIYLAFFRGILYLPPSKIKNSYYPNLRQDVCDPSGCMVPLACWITTIIIFKLAKTLIIDSVVPRITFSFKNMSSLIKFPTEWEKNYTLLPYEKTQLIQLYIENIIQFGIVVCFVTAFPLIPFLVWISNVIKIRLYAIKLIRYHKRPIPTVMTDFGIWNQILRIITYIGIVTHIFVIAFTTELIPKFLFLIQNNTFKDYIKSKLTDYYYTDANNYGNPSIKFCEFFAYRNSSSLDYAPIFFKILGGKLIFTTVMEHLLLLFFIMFTYYVPVMSSTMKNYLNQ